MITTAKKRLNRADKGDEEEKEMKGKANSEER